MGVCNSYLHDSSRSTLSLNAIKKEKKLLLVGLTSQFEEEFINKLQAVLYMNTYNHSFIRSKYNFGALTIKESTPNDLPWNAMKTIDEQTFFKLVKHWKIVDYDILLQGWFRQNYKYGNEFPTDIVKFMKLFCYIPSVHINSYKIRSINNPKHILNLLNISSIYRKCWSLTNNKECFRHKELSYCFKYSMATLFLVNLSCYNEMDTKTHANKMNRTVKLYQWFLKDYSLYLKKHRTKHGNILLVFDKIEQFKHKLTKHISLSVCCSFSKYNGSNDYDECKEFITYKFKVLNLYSNIKVELYFNEENNSKCLNKICHL